MRRLRPQPRARRRWRPRARPGGRDLPAVVAALTAPRAVWIMLPAGGATEARSASSPDCSRPATSSSTAATPSGRTTSRRARELRAKGIHYLDVGTSGGVWGLERGYCLMIGGEKEVVERLDPIFAALAPGKGDIPRTPGPRRPRSARRAGLSPCRAERRRPFRQDDPQRHRIRDDAGLSPRASTSCEHAEPERLPQEQRLDLDLADIAEVWRRGSVVTSWLLDLTAAALAAGPELGGYSGHVEDSGEGRWTVQAAIEEAVPAEVLSAALFARFRSRQEHTFAEKVLSAMRKGFGGHVEPEPKREP